MANHPKRVQKKKRLAKKANSRVVKKRRYRETDSRGHRNNIANWGGVLGKKPGGDILGGSRVSAKGRKARTHSRGKSCGEKKRTRSWNQAVDRGGRKDLTNSYNRPDRKA